MSLGNATKTTLRLGLITRPVSLFKTTGDPKDAKYDTAGPNGGKLVYKQVAVALPPDEETPDDLFEEAEGTIPRRTVETVLGTDLGAYRQVLVEEGTDVEVPKAEIRHGVRRTDGVFVDLTDGLAAINEATKLDEMAIHSFIRVEQVPRERVKASYWLAPNSPEAAYVLSVMTGAMKETRRVAVVKWTKRTRQALGVIVPHRSGGLLVLELCFTDLWREPDAKVLSPSRMEPLSSEVREAIKLIEAMADSRVSLDELEDDAVSMRRELLERASAGQGFTVPPPAPERPDITLEDALKQWAEDVEDAKQAGS